MGQSLLSEGLRPVRVLCIGCLPRVASTPVRANRVDSRVSKPSESVGLDTLDRIERASPQHLRPRCMRTRDLERDSHGCGAGNTSQTQRVNLSGCLGEGIETDPPRVRHSGLRREDNPRPPSPRPPTLRDISFSGLVINRMGEPAYRSSDSPQVRNIGADHPFSGRLRPSQWVLESGGPGFLADDSCIA
jgi:hypothetical protein